LRSLLRYALGLAALAVLGMIGYLYWVTVAPLHPPAQNYVVEPGMGLRRMNRDLHSRGVLPDSFSLVWLAYLQGRARDLKVGEYRFRDGITSLELLEQVVAGRVVEYPLTLVEGWTFRQVLATLAAAPRLTHTLQGMSAPQVMASLGYPGLHPEGRFHPDTYYYSGGMSDLIILQRAYLRMEQRLQQEWEGRAPGLPLKTPAEALTLASIIEKETARADERELIAGVFINRLRRGMKLQTDPTVIYGMGERFKGNIRLEDLRTPTPYNTYTRTGLPPTPIAMPGAASLRAALHPAETRALYFVSRGDGSHEFSETLEQHNKAVTKYQLGGRPRPARQGPARVPGPGRS